jgi:hypothetical protein
MQILNSVLIKDFFCLEGFANDYLTETPCVHIFDLHRVSQISMLKLQYAHSLLAGWVNTDNL